MPFDKNGTWVPESDDVASRVAKITAQDSPLMRQAYATGTRAANRRGLGNSSMGIGAAVSSTLSAATPIASQEAGQIHAKNLQYMGDQTQKTINSDNLAAAERERQLAALVNLTTNSNNAIANTLQNHEIPGSARSAVQRSITDQQAAVIAAMERLYGTPIDWGSLGGAAVRGGAPVMGIGGVAR